MKTLCDKEDFVVMDRPRDWRNGTYSQIFKSRMADIIEDPGPRCVKMIGYFQNLPLCREDSRQLWTPRMIENFTVRPTTLDHFVCTVLHYTVLYYTVLYCTLLPCAHCTALPQECIHHSQPRLTYNSVLINTSSVLALY